jgi:hypothetical protein
MSKLRDAAIRAFSTVATNGITWLIATGATGLYLSVGDLVKCLCIFPIPSTVAIVSLLSIGAGAGWRMSHMADRLKKVEVTGTGSTNSRERWESYNGFSFLVSDDGYGVNVAPMLFCPRCKTTMGILFPLPLIMVIYRCKNPHCHHINVTQHFPFYHWDAAFATEYGKKRRLRVEE